MNYESFAGFVSIFGFYANYECINFIEIGFNIYGRYQVKYISCQNNQNFSQNQLGFWIKLKVWRIIIEFASKKTIAKNIFINLTAEIMLEIVGEGIQIV